MLQHRWRLQCRTRRSAAVDYWTLYSSECARARERLDDSIGFGKAWNGPCNKCFWLSLRLRFRIRLVSHIRVTRPVVFLIGHVVNSATRPTCWQSIKLHFIFHDNSAGIIDTWKTIIRIRIRIYLWHSFPRYDMYYTVPDILWRSNNDIRHSVSKVFRILPSFA